MIVPKACCQLSMCFVVVYNHCISCGKINFLLYNLILNRDPFYHKKSCREYCRTIVQYSYNVLTYTFAQTANYW